MLLLRNMSAFLLIVRTAYIVINLMGKFTTLMVILGQIQTLRPPFSFSFFFVLFLLFVLSFIQVDLQRLLQTSVSCLILQIHYKYKYSSV